ncbi:hypothetical protein [Streptomyces sp. 1222.5]|uniref:hypothetical protein n=1 Tax=Streptomyces sp. 1222.5 TaxID=1881026 RepID=UPI003D7551CE
MAPHPAGTPDQALTPHRAHAATRLGPPRLGLRVAALVAVMLICWAVSYAAGQALVHHYSLTGGASAALLAGSVLAGLTAAYGLMVAGRRFIAPPRA